MSYEVSVKRALVTGASSGIGAAFARRLAASGWDLVLVGRSAPALHQVTDTPAEILTADLATTEGTTTVSERLTTTDHPIGLLVHAAGLTTAHPFGVAPLTDELAQLQVNVVATTHLLHAAVTGMHARGGGAIVLVGSTAAHWSMGSYAASKAWLEVLAGNLIARAPETGVHTLLVRPGFTRTALHDRAGVDNSGVPSWMWLSPDQVAAEALTALAEGKTMWTPSRRYRALVAATTPLPRRWRAAVMSRIAPLRAR